MSVRLEDLKKRATAAELTLIEAVETEVWKKFEHEAIVIIQRRLSNFLLKNPLGCHVGPELREWSKLFDEALKNPTP